MADQETFIYINEIVVHIVGESLDWDRIDSDRLGLVSDGNGCEERVVELQGHGNPSIQYTDWLPILCVTCVKANN